MYVTFSSSEKVKTVVKHNTSWERKACYHVANAFLSRLELIWLISKLKISKMSKKYIFGKKLYKNNKCCISKNTRGTAFLFPGVQVQCTRFLGAFL